MEVEAEPALKVSHDVQPTQGNGLPRRVGSVTLSQMSPCLPRV
jgi:hypothetical protein